MTRRIALAAAALYVLYAPGAIAAVQSVEIERAEFLATAAVTAERYSDRREAMADGFRRMIGLTAG